LHHRAGAGRDGHDGSDVHDVEGIAAWREADIDRTLRRGGPVVLAVVAGVEFAVGPAHAERVAQAQA
jgi:hypothetical protein